MNSFQWLMNWSFMSQRQLVEVSQLRRWHALGMMSAIAVSLAGCSSAVSPPRSESLPSVMATTAPSPAPTSGGRQLQVVTTFLPITQFTKAVAGDRARVTQLLPPNLGPHDYQAKPQDLQTLIRADVLVKNGLGMESFLTDLIKNAGNIKLRVIDSSQGIKTIASSEVEGHSHGKAAGEDEHDHEHDHGHAHGEFNPHIWLDPKRAIQQVETIRNGLIAADPDGKAIYTANAAAYIQQLQQLDAEITQLLRPYAGKTFVAFHDFAPYFAQSYNLKAQFLVDVPETNPSPDAMKRVVDTVKATNLKTLLTEPQAGNTGFAALAKDLQVQVSTFDPMETGPAAALQPEYYLTTMRQNVKALVSAFTGASTQTKVIPKGTIGVRLWGYPSSRSPSAALLQPVRLRG